MLLPRNVSKITPDTTFSLLQHLHGGSTFIAGMPFVDVTDKAGPVLREWSDKAPEWRRAAPGMWLEGECTNEGCKAHKKMVVMNWGYYDFDFINESHRCKCLMCNEVVPSTCGFNNCCWKVVSRRVHKLGERPRVVNSAWNTVGDRAARFSPYESGIAHFIALHFTCRKEVPEDPCVACAEVIQTEYSKKKATCGHTFHYNCFKFATSTDRNCIECMAKANMTQYQRMVGS